MHSLLNLKEGILLVKKAIEEKEKIYFYSDSDLDGVSSAIILKEAIENLGGKLEKIYFPKREEGYGLTEKGMKFLLSLSGGFLICLDLGTTNFKEIKKLKKKFKVIIIDHHRVLGKLPPALLINPHQRKDLSPFKYLSTAGLVLKFARKLLKRDFKKFENEFFLLAALATLYDMMPQKGENKKIIEKGKKFFPFSQRWAFKILQENKINFFPKIISILNSADVKDHFCESYLFLTAKTKKRAQKIFKILKEKEKEKKKKIKEVLKEIKKSISFKKPFIFKSSPSWPISVLGAVASILTFQFKKPVFLIKRKSKICFASIRAPKDFNTLPLLRKCSKFFIGWGGHPQASGFRCKRKDYLKVKKCIFSYFNEN